MWWTSKAMNMLSLWLLLFQNDISNQSTISVYFQDDLTQIKQFKPHKNVFMFEQFSSVCFAINKTHFYCLWWNIGFKWKVWVDLLGFFKVKKKKYSEQLIWRLFLLDALHVIPAMLSYKANTIIEAKAWFPHILYACTT